MQRLSSRIALAFIAMACLMFSGVRTAESTVRIDVDLSTQRMHVDSLSGAFDFSVSSARRGYSTPLGVYKPQKLVRMHYSKKYHNSPMPYSIFFRGGYAIHGTGAVRQLGRPASHGCIRLSPANAAVLYDLVKQEGARISITGTPPGKTMIASYRGTHKTLLATARGNKDRHPSLAYAPQLKKSLPNSSLRFWLFDPMGQ